MKKIYLFYLLLLVPFALKAQDAPVDNKFKGEWTFDFAVVQEQFKTGDNLSEEILSYEEFCQNANFHQVPTEVSFFEIYDGYIANPYFRELVAPVINNGILSFRIRHDDLNNETEAFTIFVSTFSQLFLDNDQMSMRYHYSYYNEQNKEIIGNAKIVYKKKRQ